MGDIIELTEKDIIEWLSGIHKEKSTDPETLYGTTLTGFNLKAKDFPRWYSHRDKLFHICRERGDVWTKV